MIKLLLIILLGYHSYDVSVQWQVGKDVYVLTEKYADSVQGGYKVTGAYLNRNGDPEPIKPYYEKRHYISKPEFLLWYWIYNRERQRRKSILIQQSESKLKTI